MLQCRAYHAGQNYYVEVDVVMDENMPLKTTHDVSQTLQRKLEGQTTQPIWQKQPNWHISGLANVERAYVHVDYEDEHDIHEEHKPLYEITEQKSTRERVKRLLSFKKEESAS